jgi:hypothetical protein
MTSTITHTHEQQLILLLRQSNRLVPPDLPRNRIARMRAHIRTPALYRSVRQHQVLFLLLWLLVVDLGVIQRVRGSGRERTLESASDSLQMRCHGRSVCAETLMRQIEKGARARR